MHKLRDASGDAEAHLRRQLEEIAGDGAIYVLGLGNTDRADDGAGVVVAEALKERFPLRCFSERDGIEGAALDISERDEDAAVFFVDAGSTGGHAGEIRIVRREDIREAEITTHRVAVALMASLLDRSGKKSAVVCIQPASTDFRSPLSRAVSDSVDRLVRIFTQMLDQHLEHAR